MSKKNKQQNKHKFNFREILSNVRVTEHFKEQLRKRFDMNAEEVDFNRFKIGNSSCSYSTVRHKLAQGRNIMVAFNSHVNLLVPIDLETKTVITALYLDGKDGYDL